MTDVYGKVAKPFWDDRPVAVIGSGPSIKDIDLEKLRGAHVLAVKGMIFDVPWADAGFGIDAARYLDWRDRLADVQARVYWAVPTFQLASVGIPPKNVTLLKRDNGNGFTDPGVISGGGSVGYAAMQICIHKQAKHIVLFGFDYKPPEAQQTRDPYVMRRYEHEARNWEIQAEQFALYAPFFSRNGITVANACPSSNIRCFQRVEPRDGIAMLRQRTPKGVKTG